MRGWRLAFYSLLLCLPAVLIVAIGGWLVVRDVPRAIRREPSRIGGEYREIAENLAARPETATGEGDRRKGWTQNGKIDGVAWGYSVEGKTARIWYATGPRKCRWVEQPAIAPFPYELVFYVGGGAVAAILFALSTLAVWYFVRYVKSRDDFLAATAHDLTTPLVGLRLMIGRNDGEAKRLNERMIRLVENLKDFLRLGGTRRKPTMGEVDLVAAFREAYSLFREDYRDLFDGEDVAEEGVPPEGRLLVSADETLTVQILWNLLGNDLKYAAPYGRVKAVFAQDGRRASFALVDEGQGMSRRQMARAFDRYYRARTVLESGKGGFGIGLCTAREFARAMGGELTVRANAPKGCVFTLILPLGR